MCYIVHYNLVRLGNVKLIDSEHNIQREWKFTITFILPREHNHRKIPTISPGLI